MWLLFIWGSREREKRRGAVAEYCPVCRKIGTFEVVEIRKGLHVWFIPIVPGQLLRTIQICRTCGRESMCSVGRYASIRRFAGGSLEPLITATFPKIREVYREELATANLIATGGVDPEMRQRLIREAFGMAEPHFGAGYGHKGRLILTRALNPLRPTADEIQAGLQPYRGTWSRMGMQLTIEEVMISIYPELEVKDPNKFSY